MYTIEKHFFAILLSGWLIVPLSAQIALGPDVTFGQHGSWEVLSPNPVYNVLLALQADQKIIQANTTEPDGLISVTRLLANGSPDPAYGFGGSVELGNGDDVFIDLNMATVMPSGSILLTLNAYGFDGTDDIDLTRFIRLLPDGTPDPAFGQNGTIDHDLSAGILEEYITGGLALPDGKFLGVGYTLNQNDIARSVIVRLNADGSLDNTYGSNGLLFLNPLALLHIAQDAAILSDGKIMVVGAYLDLQGNARCYLARLQANGAVDITFGQNGIVRLTALPGSRFPAQIAVGTDGAIYLAGGTEDGELGWVARALPNGTIDNAFNQNGYRDFSLSEFTEIGKLALQPNGGVLVGGFSGDFDPITFSREARHFVCRLLPDGSPDQAFYDAGYLWSPVLQETSLDGMLLQNDGKMLISGYEADDQDGFRKFVRRYIVSGTSGLTDRPAVLSNARVFPNPAAESTQISFEITEPTQLTMQLIATDGRAWPLATPEAGYPVGYHQVRLHLPAGIPTGAYQLAIRSEKGIQVLPLYINR